MKKQEHCQFCFALYTPPLFYRSPSQTCSRCWLEISAALTQEGSEMKEYPHGCDTDHEYEEIAAAQRLAHENFECKPPCDYCEAEAAAKETEDK